MSFSRFEIGTSSDVLDQASNLAETARAQQEAVIRARVKPEQVQNKDGAWPETECRDCGDDLEEGRLALAKVRCIKCQTLKEKREKGY